MEHQAGPGGLERPDGNDACDQWQDRHRGCRDSGSGRDLARTARSLGFSPEEVFEIERLYLTSPGGALK